MGAVGGDVISVQTDHRRAVAELLRFRTADIHRALQPQIPVKVETVSDHFGVARIDAS